jgi:hypothetical protein
MEKILFTLLGVSISFIIAAIFHFVRKTEKTDEKQDDKIEKILVSVTKIETMQKQIKNEIGNLPCKKNNSHNGSFVDCFLQSP